MMKASVSMITRCISVALLVSAVPSVMQHGWMEARGDAMGAPAWHQHTTVPRRCPTRRC
jgi:hypothetical protein